MYVMRSFVCWSFFLCIHIYLFCSRLFICCRRRRCLVYACLLLFSLFSTVFMFFRIFSYTHGERKPPILTWLPCTALCEQRLTPSNTRLFLCPMCVCKCVYNVNAFRFILSYYCHFVFLLLSLSLWHCRCILHILCTRCVQF